MPSQTLIVGDIQGCFEGLKKLLQEADFEPKRDKLIAAGDLVARGEGSLTTVEYLMSLGNRFTAVLGNHDLNLLAVSQGYRQARESDHLDALLSSPKLSDVLDWMRQFPLAQRLSNDHFLVHAGLYPQWSMDEALQYAQEVSDVLRSNQWRSLLKNMYGSEPRRWQSDLTGFARYRFIINACTRMRFLTSDLSLELDTSSAPQDAPNHLQPWYEFTNASLAEDEKILFGHWASLEGETGSDRFIGLDTGYVWGNSMTAYRLEDGTRFSVTAK